MFVIAATAVGLWLAVTKPDPFGGGRELKVRLADASGLAPVGADVRVAGVPVGEISGSRRVGDGAELTLELGDEAGPVYENATAELRPHLIFEGTAFVDLEPGSPASAALPDGGEIPVEQTSAYVPIDEALRTFSPDARAALQDTARDLDRAFAEPGASGVQRTSGNAPELTERGARVARAAGGSEGDELEGAVQGLAGATEAIASERESLVPLLDGADRTLAALGTESAQPVDASLAELPGTLADLESGARSLDGILTRLEPLAVDLRPGVRELAPTLSQARPLVSEARPVLEKLGPFVSDLRRALRDGARATPATVTALEKLQPTIETLDESLLPALHQPTEELGVPAYVAFLNLFGGGGGASRPFTTEESATPLQPETGHFMRFGLRFLTGVGTPAPPCDLLAQANPELAAALSAAGGCTP